MSIESISSKLRITKKQISNVWHRIFGTKYTVPSMDDYRFRLGKKYQVTHEADGSWNCTCESFRYHSGVITVLSGELEEKHKDTCKHIRLKMKEEGFNFTIVP